MATLSDKYVNSLIAKADDMINQRKASVQKQYNAWAAKQKSAEVAEMQPVSMDTSVADMQATTPDASNAVLQSVAQKIPVLTAQARSATAPYANDAAANAAMRTNANFDAISQYAKQTKEDKKRAAKNDSNVYMDEDGNVDVNSAKKNARATTPQRMADAAAKRADKPVQAKYTEDGKLDVAALQNDPRVQQMTNTQSLEGVSNGVTTSGNTVKDATITDKIDYYTNKWLDPSYVMTEEDKRMLESLISDYKQEHKDDKDLFTLFGNEFSAKAQNNPQKYPEVQKLLKARQKTSLVNSFLQGINNSLDNQVGIAIEVGKALDNHQNDEMWDAYANQRKIDAANASNNAPGAIASGAGTLAGIGVQYKMTNDILGGLADQFSFLKWLKPKNLKNVYNETKSLGQVAKAYAENTAKQYIPDFINDTAPEFLNNIAHGESKEKVLEDLAGNVIINNVFNAGMAIPELVSTTRMASKAIKALDAEKELYRLSNATDAIRRANEINALNRADDVTSVRQADGALRETDINPKQTMDDLSPLEAKKADDLSVRADVDAAIRKGVQEEIKESGVSVFRDNPVTGERNVFGSATSRRLDEIANPPKEIIDAVNADPALKEATGNAWAKYIEEFEKADAGQANALRAATNALAEALEAAESASGVSIKARQNLDNIYNILMHSELPDKFNGTLSEVKNPLLDMIDEQGLSNIRNSTETVKQSIEDALYRNMKAIQENETLKAKVQDVTDAYDKWVDAVYSGIGDTERLGKDVRNAMGRAERAFANEGLSGFHVSKKMAEQIGLADIILKQNTPEGYVPPVIRETTADIDGVKVNDTSVREMPERIGDEARMTIDPTKNAVEPTKSVTEPVQPANPDQPNMKTRKTYSNTMQNSDIFPEKELAENQHYAKEEFGYLEQPESESLEKASDILASNKEGQKRRFASDVLTPETAKHVEASDIDSIYMMIRENNEAIENAIDAAEIARLRRENGIMTQNLARINTNAGQVVQANAKWSRTPEGMRIQADAFKKGKVDEILKEADWGGDVTRLEDNIVKRIDELIDSKMWDDLKASDGVDSQKGLDLIRDELAREINNAAAKAKQNISNTDIDNLAKKIQQKLLSSPDIDKIEDQLMSDDIWQMVAGVGDITEEHMDEALKLLDEAKQFNPNSKDAAKRIDAAYLILANDIGHGKSFMDKLDAWRYFAMLSKPTTHLRNMLGNTTFGLVTGAENSLSAVLEAGLDRASKIARNGKGIERTKSLLGPQDADLISACARDFNDNAYGLYKGNKYYEDLAAGIEKMVKTFDNKGVGKAANFLTETNTALLDAEDVIFGQSKYATSLAGYLKANGYGIDALKSEDPAVKRVVEDARAYALSKANEATFHNNSAFAKLTTEIDHGLREWSRLDWGNGNSVKKAVGLAGRHIEPFVKTPANILSAILSRGPQESIKVLYDLVQLAKHNPNVKAKDLIEDISKTASGTMILGLGAYLYSTGHIELGGETDNERYNKKSRGITGPSLKFGNTYVALNDGNVPTAILAMGANLAQAYKNKKGGLDAFLDGLASVSDTVVDTTMLSGIADVLNSARYSKDNADLASRIGMQVITNAAGQYIPNVTRGLENVVDSEKRNTSYTGQTGVMDTLGKSLQYASTGIPFLQEGARAAKDSGIPILEDIGNAVALNPQVDRWGNDIEKVGGDALGRLANNTINPTSITTDQSNALDKEIDRLYERLTDDTNGEPIMSVDEAKKLFTYTPNAESKFDGVPLSRDDWYKYQQERGKSRYDLMNAVVNSRYYKYLTDEEKATMLKEMDDISKNYTREKYGAEIKNKKMAKLVDAYKEGGAKAVLNIKGENIDTTRTPEARMKEDQKAQAEEQKFEAASDDIMGTLQKAGVVDKYAESVPKEAREAYAEYGMQGVEDYATVKSNKKGASYEKYSSLKSEIPTLTAKEYADIYNNFSVPNEKGEYNNYFTKDTELIPYLTSRAWDNDEQLNLYAHALSPSVEGTWHIVNGKLYYNKPSVERWRDNGKEYSAEAQARVNNVVSLFKK